MPFLSGYRIMWLLVMFDLPVLTKRERKAATNFREHLQNLGFERCQFSVYLRCCSGKEKVEFFVGRIRERLPEGGKVDMLSFTDKQYEKIISFQSRIRKRRKNPDQYALF